MFYSLRSSCRLAILLLLAILPLGAIAQVFIAEPQQVDPPKAVKEVLTEYKIFRLNALNIKRFIEESPENSSTLQLQLGGHKWNLRLEPSQILAPGYSLRVQTEKGVENRTRTDHRAFKGVELGGGGKVRLTLDKDFIHGFIDAEGDRFYLEPLWYHQPDAPRDLFLCYPISAVNRDVDATCIELAGDENISNLPIKVNPDAPEFQACYEMEIAIASDKSMHTKYGSVSAVENHNIAVINDVNGDYSGQFNHDIEIVIVTQFVVTGTDPWTPSTNAGTLLASFRDWGNANGFGVPFDNGELWTNRDFDGSTVGIAYIGGVCNANKYHCLQDFTSNSELLRCMTSHEIGHNFTASHDPTSGSCPPNFIMCPFVSTATNWSANSISQISGYITTKINSGCLQACSSGPPLSADFEWAPNPACEDEQVQFTDLSTGNITSRSWTFPGGTPPNSTQTNPMVIWANPGTYNVTLTISGPGGSATASKPVVVGAKPTANFSYTYTGLTYNFTSTSTNATTYSWDFGDGVGYSSEQNPVYTYAESGIYSVTLFVENDCGTATKSNLIVTIPTAAFSASPTSGCASMTVQFTNESSSNSNTFLWQFPGGQPSTSNLTNPVVVYSTSGSYTVTLTAFNGAGSNTATYTNYITVQNIPSANFTKTIDSLTVTFTNTSVGANTFLWNFGDGNTSTQTSPVHTYATGGTYTVTLTASNPCGTTTATQTINLTAPPSASFTATPTSGCGPLTVQFTSTSTGNPTSYNWSFPGGSPSSSTAQNPTVTYNNPGSYTVSLTVSNNVGSTTATQANFITVNTVPNAGFNTTVNLDTVAFTNTTTGGTSYNWNFGDGDTSTMANPVHIYAADGTYTVTLISNNACGADTVSHTVTIVTPPTAGFTASPTSGCGPLTVQFTNTSSSNATSFLWSFPGGTPDTSSLENPSVIYSAPGSYAVTLVVSNAAGTDTATVNSFVTVNPGPTAGFTSTTNGFTATFTNTSTNGTSYSWDFGDGNTSTAPNPVHVYDEDGPFTVVLTATNACGTNTFTQVVTIITPPTAGFTATPTSGCGPLTVQFTNTSSSNATTFNWSFPGGTPASSTDEDPTVTYSTPGNYTVTLTVSNPAGSNTATQTNFITVNSGPTAGFSSTTNGPVATFTNTSTNGTSYSWNFGDGNSSTQSNPTHNYAADGTYTVVLTATNACGTSTFSQAVVIITAPTAGFTATPTSGCGPLTVQFTNTSSTNATTFNWSFPGGTPSSSTAEDPTVNYNAPGTYTVTLTASNAAGSNTLTQTNFITVQSNPTAGFTTAVNGATATFTNTSTNGTSYNWNFGDGNSSTAANPVHVYGADGTYTVVLTTSNACGTSTSSQNVTIATPPTAGFTATPTSGCGPLTVQFTNTSSSNATSFNWSFPGGMPASSAEENPVVTYNSTGTYSVTLTASNAVGSNSATQTNYITVNADPTAGFTAAVNAATAIFTNTTMNGASYSWDFGDGNTSTTANPTHTYSTDGVYTVILTATNACGTSTFSQTVTIVLPPTAAFTPSNAEGCAPLTVTFTNNSSANATSFEWTFEGGDPAASTDAEPTVTFDQPGIYQVTLVASNAAGSSTSTATITVNGPPTAGFTAQTAGLSVVLTNTSTNATSYAWDFGDGNTSTAANPTHTYGSTGMYTVVLRATNACGTTEFSQQVEIMGTAPIAAFSASEQKVCAPMTVQFTDQSAGDPSAWNWTFPGGAPASSTQQNPQVNYALPGVYPVTLEVTNAWGSNTLTIQNFIEVLALPTASFTYNANQTTVTFNNLSQNGDAYQWNFGDGATSQQVNPVHTYAMPGTYTVELTVVNNCGASTLQQMIMLVSGAGEAPWVSFFRLYPNPGSGLFTLEMQGEAQNELEFTLFNNIGQLIDRQTADFGAGALNKQFDYSRQPAGMYTLLVRSGIKTVQVKLSIQR